MALKDVDLKQHVSTGSYDIEFDLEKLVAALDERSEEVVNIIEKHVYDKCPRDTGLMASTVRSDKTETGEYEVLVGGINGCDYAAYTNWREGTSCSHWFEDAVDEAKQAASQVWSNN